MVFLVLCFYLLCLPSPVHHQDLPDQCIWSDCGVDNCSKVEGHPFKLESGACLEPDGMSCNNRISVLCCVRLSTYKPYWSGTPPSCTATCEDCTLIGDFCFGYTRKCSDHGESCKTGSEVLCGTYTKKRTIANVGAIVGGTIGGIVVVIIAVTGIISGLFCYRKNMCSHSCSGYESM